MILSAHDKFHPLFRLFRRWPFGRSPLLVVWRPRARGCCCCSSRRVRWRVLVVGSAVLVVRFRCSRRSARLAAFGALVWWRVARSACVRPGFRLAFLICAFSFSFLFSLFCSPACAIGGAWRRRVWCLLARVRLTTAALWRWSGFDRAGAGSAAGLSGFGFRAGFRADCGSRVRAGSAGLRAG